MKILFALFTFTLVISFSVPTAAQTKPAPIKIVPPNLYQEIEKKAAAEPNITPAMLAKYANDLLAKKGFDFQFDLCEFLKKYNRTPPSRLASNKPRTYRLPMTQTDGRPVVFEAQMDSEGMGPCGECFVSIPATRVTAKEIEIIAGGKKYVVVRPRMFALDDIDLVDQTMKRKLRTWPFNGTPVGVSSDGTKLYFETNYESDTSTIRLELSETGAMRFFPRDELKLPKGEEVKKHPIDRRNDYLSFLRFRFGARSLIIRYTEPCT